MLQLQRASWRDLTCDPLVQAGVDPWTALLGTSSASLPVVTTLFLLGSEVEQALVMSLGTFGAGDHLGCVHDGCPGQMWQVWPR